MAKRNFEVFDKRRAPAVPTPFVSQRTDGTFAMNLAAYNLLGHPEFIEFLWDAENQVIGFRAGDPKAPHVYEIKQQTNSKSFYTAGRQFCRSMGIPTGKTIRFKAEMEDDVLVVSLKHPREGVSGGDGDEEV